MKPVIGISCNYDFKSENTMLYRGYYEAVLRAGGLPFLIACSDMVRAKDLMGHIDGLLLTGGQDINPYLFGQDPDPNIASVNPIRDELELGLCREAIDRNMPVLGICKGLQIMAIASGASLYQDIGTGYGRPTICHNQKAPGCYGIHEIDLKPNSLLRDILKADKLRVNSFHHQAVKDPGKSLEVSARASDLIIEAIESTSLSFFLGVQWHPEKMLERDSRMLCLFKALVERAGLNRS